MTGQLSLFKGARQRGVKLPPALEKKTHIMVADVLRLSAQPGWRWSHFPAGELRQKQTADLLKRMGLQPGWPDFVLLSPVGRFHGLELKRGKAPLTVDQQAFQAWCYQHLVPYTVARSFDEAIEQLAAWGAVRVRL